MSVFRGTMNIFVGFNDFICPSVEATHLSERHLQYHVRLISCYNVFYNGRLWEYSIAASLDYVIKYILRQI